MEAMGDMRVITGKHLYTVLKKLKGGKVIAYLVVGGDNSGTQWNFFLRNLGFKCQCQL